MNSAAYLYSNNYCMETILLQEEGKFIIYSLLSQYFILSNNIRLTNNRKKFAYIHFLKAILK